MKKDIPRVVRLIVWLAAVIFVGVWVGLNVDSWLGAAVVLAFGLLPDM